MEEKLNYLYGVTVFTTTANNYITWENHYQEEEIFEDKIKVKRFKIEKLSKNDSEFKEIEKRRLD